jgi:hypothetical protein
VETRSLDLHIATDETELARAPQEIALAAALLQAKIDLALATATCSR